jgi:hypothetical protein
VIPRSEIETAIDVDPTLLSAPTAERVISGVACIHGYEPGVFPGATWAGAAETLQAEREELTQLDATCADEVAFDDAAFEARGELWLSLEFGITGVVEALCAAGCPTFASCRGHIEGSGGRSLHPWVLFAADGARLPLLVQVARTAGCGLEHDERGLLVMIAPSLVEAIEFGRTLLAKREEFDTIPAVVDRDAVASAGEDDELW